MKNAYDIASQSAERYNVREQQIKVRGAEILLQIAAEDAIYINRIQSQQECLTHQAQRRNSIFFDLPQCWG